MKAIAQGLALVVVGVSLYLGTWAAIFIIFGNAVERPLIVAIVASVWPLAITFALRYLFVTKPKQEE